VYVSSKLPTVATLRCLGATRAAAFTTYLIEAGGLGLVGATLGAALGVGVQLALPRVLVEFLPVRITPRLSLATVGGGIALGVGVAMLFALLPLLAIRHVSPLRALRHDVEDLGAWYRDRARWGVIVALVGLAIGLSVWQAPHWIAGLTFGAGVTATIAILWVFALLLRRAARRFFPKTAPYALRQGVANLFRPHNQTIAVTLAAGFGIFLLTTVGVIQHSLITQLTVDPDAQRPNLVLFDVQSDQRDSVVAMLEASRSELREVTPIIPARIEALRGVPIADVLTQDPNPPDRWALRREYRHTYRASLTETEKLVAGTWWTEPRDSASPARVSIEEDIAAELHVGLGDRLTWDVQGVSVETVITSVRRVNWARFETNFFFVFEPGVLDEAPQTVVALVRQVDEAARARVQRDIVRRFPNVSIIDLASVQQALDRIVSNVTLAIRFMALFSLATGIIVLIGAVATSRFQRLRESVLLRTLGARGHQVRTVLLAEYAALGMLSAVTGSVLGLASGWSLVRFFFELEITVPVAQVLAFAGGAVGLTMLIGATSSRDVLRRAPLAVLRQLSD
jgi:putative ABC transport system permease protein